eukprot:TRINITY_DN5928_c0_g1_i1.p1 TRINITY_DN5928_c0_g1~~TRINITY_DN5928_c0_g1_i1.p1  ORF type:complete len:458 (-),score=67.76 TRINITY_DN5928_c0_g1_i1:25-1398(-)
MAEVDSCNVFIKYLPPEVTDSGLYAMFSPCGEIVSCKVMLDPITKNSLGYGFCRFSCPTEAQTAVEKMSGVKCGQKTLLCKLSNSSPGPQMSCNLYVKPLPQGKTKEDLERLFGPFGEILECKVMTDKEGSNMKQVGFVRFSNIQDASSALKRMNGYQFTPESPQLVVKYAETTPQKAQRKAKFFANQNAASARQAVAYYTLQQQTQSALASMYNGNSHVLPYVITDAFGNVTYAPMSSPMGMSYDANYPAVYPPQISPFFLPGYVPSEYPYQTDNTTPTYTPEMAHYPGPMNHDSSENGKSSLSDNNSTNSNLFVFHLPASVDDNALFSLFAPFGSLQSVRVMVDTTTGRSRGFGFVQYRHFSEAAQAISEMNGYQVENKYLKVAFKTPNDKGPQSKPRFKRRSGRKGARMARDELTAQTGLPKPHRNEPITPTDTTTLTEAHIEGLKLLTLEDTD